MGENIHPWLLNTRPGASPAQAGSQLQSAKPQENARGRMTPQMGENGQRKVAEAPSVWKTELNITRQRSCRSLQAPEITMFT